ncbi:MAG: LPS-assembly protein LptD [Spirochaetaceae bacterium]|jgi:hypothetical protein|nr:LPS-assembly protein LptD [Spirochaetaceae bacterium]
MTVSRRRLPGIAVLVLALTVWALPVLSQEGGEIREEDALIEEGAAGDEGAEGEEAPEGEGAPEEEPGLTPEQKILEMDIKTSSLEELANWCRLLGLSEGGGREELANRLRSHYGLPSPAGQGEPEGKTIIIESARSTEYFTLETVDEEYARLQGDVVVSLKDGTATHRIKAWEILYNRTRNIMTATGNVEYIKEDGDTVETFRGASITVDLDNWSSIFLNGISERSLSGDENAYLFQGELISRSDQEATILADAEITNAKKEESYWSIRASRLWLLPGSDWAVFNAFLKVGEIPVLYIPFFIFPSDELIFHPVIGFRTREGTFIQTTTYLLGRSPEDTATESSITNILGGGKDMERRREGIFLRSTGKKSTDPNTTRLSFLADAYANLGLYLGTIVILPPAGRFGTFDLDVGIGFTRNIYQIGGNYSPFGQGHDESQWNSSRFFSVGVPFRYRLTTKGSLSGKLGSLSWTLPAYSDPYTDLDFLDRSEDMDWFKLIKGETDDTSTTTTISSIASYEWRLSGSSSPSFPFLAPAVSSLSISSLTSAVAFRSKTATDGNGLFDDVNRNYFFYPDKATLYSFSASVSGTPLTLGNSSSGAASSPDSSQEELPENPLGDIGVPLPPWEESAADPAALPDDPLRPPALAQRFNIPLRGGPQFTIGYLLNPSGTTELQFRPADWKKAEDVDWADVESVLSSFRADGSTTFTFQDPANGAYSTAVRVFGTAAWQDYSFLEETTMTAAQVDAAWERVYSATSFTTSAESITTIKPLYESAVWGNSNIQYTLQGLIAKSSFIPGGGKDNKTYEMIYGDWEDEKIDIHRLGLNLAASIRDKNQTLSLTADLPPKDAAFSGDAFFRIWYTETNVRGRLKDPFDTKVWEPLYITETLRFSSNTYFQQSLVYTPEVDDFTSLTSSLVWKGLSASFNMVRSHTYVLYTSSDQSPNGQQGWQQNTSESERLNPRDLRMAYNGELKRDSLWDGRLSFSVRTNTSLLFDMQRYTYSKFTFGLGLTLGILNFLDLSLNTSSENAVIFRYFQDLPFINFGADLQGERNLFIDLLNSFRFDREDLRRNSGFKLKSINLSLNHHLGDWDAKLSLTMTPYLDQTATPWAYRMNPEVSFTVQWIPVSEIKTEIIYNEKENKFTY